MRIHRPPCPTFCGCLLVSAVLLCSGLLSGFMAQAGPPAPPSSPGLVDYQPFLQFSDEDGDIIEINVSGSLLRALAGGISAKAEPELQGLLSNLQSISALVLTVLPQQEDAARRLVESRGNELRQKGWEEVARVRSKEEKIRVLALNQGDHIGGLVVMILSKELDILESDGHQEGDKGGRLQLVFANIAGKFSLEQLKHLEGKIDVPGLDKVLEEKETGKPRSQSRAEPQEPEDPSGSLLEEDDASGGRTAQTS